VITDNVIGGNFSRFYGGGISHAGLSNNGLISRNQIIFNEVAFGGALFGDGGGIFVGSTVIPGLVPGVPPAPETPGSGNVTIDRNLIQGNLAGVGRGGGIMSLFFNGPDIDGATPGYQSYTLTITNNMIVNNAAGWNGGGIALQDVTDARIINNTIANNDSTSTAANAFPAGSVDTIPHGAGIVSNIHSAALQADSGQIFSDPLLQNNIIWNNRAFFTTNGGEGGLIAAGEYPGGLYGNVWDLAVEGMTTPTFLSPTYSLLTSLTYPDGGDYSTGTGNFASDEPRFVLDYVNQLFTAAVLDEGGNFITLRFKPLMRSSGDYHLRFNSPAANAGTDAAATLDYDGEARTAGSFDIGADEFVAATYTALTLLTPNGGEEMISGEPYGIYWGIETPNAYDHYSLHYSLDNGANWKPIADNLTTDPTYPGLGFYDWTIPPPASNKNNKVLVRIRAFNAANTRLAVDKSDAPASIVVVRLITPNGNEMLTVGSPYTIKWEIEGTKRPVAKIRLEYMRMYPDGSWHKVAAIKGTDPGSFDWTVPPLAEPVVARYTARVRVMLYDQSGGLIGRDISDNDFYIQPNLFP
jgi:hypothetical protein